MALDQLTLFFDRGVLEAFANNGAVCSTRRSYAMAAIWSLEISPAAETRIDAHEAWAYGSAWQ